MPSEIGGAGSVCRFRSRLFSLLIRTVRIYWHAIYFVRGLVYAFMHRFILLLMLPSLPLSLCWANTKLQPSDHIPSCRRGIFSSSSLSNSFWWWNIYIYDVRTNNNETQTNKIKIKIEWSKANIWTLRRFTRRSSSQLKWVISVHSRLVLLLFFYILGVRIVAHLFFMMDNYILILFSYRWISLRSVQCIAMRKRNRTIHTPSSHHELVKHMQLQLFFCSFHCVLRLVCWRPVLMWPAQYHAKLKRFTLFNSRHELKLPYFVFFLLRFLRWAK